MELRYYFLAICFRSRHLADDIGIISNGTLVYEGSYNNVDDLEKLFTEVVKGNKLN